MHAAAPFPAPISEDIWDRKYRLKAPDGSPREATLGDTMQRVAEAAASREKGGGRIRKQWAARYAEALSSLEFLPAGRILAGAGTDRAVTLFNCFVMGPVPDDLSGIFEAVRESALTLQSGGGIGQDFSTLRPQGARVHSIGADASGPVSFMDVWDAMCRTIMSAGARRGAMMATLRCDHPDIETFIAAKQDATRLRNFNLSVLVTDAFMAAVASDAPWDLRFDGRVVRTVAARALWDRLMRATYDYAEPGVIFIDRVNALNNLAYCEEIRATNPCGEQPLPPHGACLLGSINLARLVIDPFTSRARLDTDRLEARTGLAVRFLDSLIDISRYPLESQRREALAKRRIGLGVTGLANALIYCGAHYGRPEGVALAEDWMRRIQGAAYRASAHLAAEKGAFPLYDRSAMLERPSIAALDPETRAVIAQSGLRNGCLTSIAPTGTISLLAGNVSSGIEPVFDLTYRRRLLDRDGASRELVVEDEAYRTFRARHGNDAPLPPAFVTATDLPPAAHVAMQAALQRHVDSAISKTVNCPADIDFAAFKDVYRMAYAQGLKGCTTFRPNAVTGSVLSPLRDDWAAAAADEPSAMADAEGRDLQGARRPGSVTASATDDPAIARATPPRSTITGSASGTTAPSARGGDIVYMSKPLERDHVLGGYTYKLKWPASDHAIYVTINDIERDGRRRPFEIFINTRNLEHYAWTVALTRMISAVFRRGGDVTFVAEELRAVFDPQGGQWMGGRYVPSLLAAIGEVIDTHMTRIGFRQAAGGPIEAPVDAVPVRRGAEAALPQWDDAAGAWRAAELEPTAESGELAETGGPPQAVADSAAGGHRHRFCPRCSANGFQKREGCWVCRTCGFSRCG